MSQDTKSTVNDDAQGIQLRFWLFQLCGWLPFFALMLPFFGDDKFLSKNALLFASSLTFIAMLGTLVLRRLFRFLSDRIKKSSLWLAVLFLGTIPFAMLVAGLHQGLWHAITLVFTEPGAVYQNQPYLAITGLLWIVYVFWGSLYLLLTNQQKLNRAVIKQQQLELLIKENKINNLLEQLNPHFMFNTINNIRSLILRDTEKAREMLSSFADIMRYQINSNNDALVPLQDELSFVLEYIELMRLQLGKRLNFEQDIDASLLTNFIPRMALQLLVENAIKHGFGQSAKPATLKIIISHAQCIDSPRAWYLSVQNSGKIAVQKSTSGIGLKNLQDRLKLGFADNYTLSLTEKNDMVEAKILFAY
jgi:two-component system LytT family sensor kinase